MEVSSVEIRLERRVLMQKLFEYIRNLDDTREILRHCPNAHVSVPDIDTIIDDLSRLSQDAEVELSEWD